MTARIVGFSLLCAVLCGLLAPLPATAQPGGVWSDVMQLSDDATFAQGPSLVLDQSGALHAFWSSRPVANSDARFAIAHSAIVSGTWLAPQEIVLSPNNRDAHIPRVAVDGDNNLHLFWATSGWVGELYHTWAPATQAHFSTAWSAPELIDAAVYQHDVVSDKDGNLHLVYASRSQGICHVALDAEMGIWSEPSCLTSGVLRDQEYDTRPSVALDQRGIMHIVWTVGDESPESVLAYGGRAVYYARSVDGGLSWSSPLLIDETESRAQVAARAQPEWPTIEVDAQDRVHIVWVGQSMHRYHTVSSDHGETWSQPQVAIPVGGYNNWMALAAGKDDLLHFVTASLDGLVYSYWNGSGWSPMMVFRDTRGAHYVDALTAADGSLHTVWQDHGGGNATEGHILYAYWGAPGVGLTPLSGVQITPTPLPAAQKDISLTNVPAATATAGPPGRDWRTSASAGFSSDPDAPSTVSAIGVSVLSTGIFVLIALLLSNRSYRNR